MGLLHLQENRPVTQYRHMETDIGHTENLQSSGARRGNIFGIRRRIFYLHKGCPAAQGGDELTLFDGMGHEYSTIIRNFSSRDVCLDIIRKEAIRLPDTRITFAQSLPKGGGEWK